MTEKNKSPRRTTKGVLLLLALSVLCVFIYSVRSSDSSEPLQTSKQSQSAGKHSLPIASEQKDQDTPPVPVGDQVEAEMDSEIAGPSPLIPYPRGENQRRLYGKPEALEIPEQLLNSEAVVMAKLPADGRTELLANEIDSYTLTAKRLAFNASAFDMIVSGQSARLIAPTTGDELIEVYVDSIKTRSAQTHTLQGKIAGEPLSSVQFVYHDGIVHGNVTHPTKALHYEYRILSDGYLMVRVLDHAAMTARCGKPDSCESGKCGHSDHEETDSIDPIQDELREAGLDLQTSDSKEGSVEGDTSGWTTVDLVVGYGREARIADGGLSQIEARILDAVDRMNTAFVNSEITNTEMMLLGTIEDPDYVFPGTTSGDMGSADELGNLSNTNDGILDAITDYASQLGADFQSLIVKSADGSAGIAWRPGNSSVTGRNYLTPTRLTFAHELGHNLGCDHSWGDSNQAYNGHYGWRMDPDGSSATTSDRVRTIMAYDWGWGNGWRVPYYGNPNVLYGSAPTGAALGYDATGDPYADQRYVTGGLGYTGSVTNKSGFDGTNPALGARNYLTILTGQGVSSYGAGYASNRSTRVAFDVVSPVANAEYRPGDDLNIFFIGGDQEYTATVSLYKGGVLNATIASNLNPATGRNISWSIPNGQASGSDYFVRVMLSHPSHGDVPMDSGQFSISQVLAFNSDAYSISEDGGTATITVNRTGGSAGTVSVDYATSNGTASAGSDYIATSGTLNWANGESSSKTFDITINDDSAIEDTEETIILTLSNPSSALLSGTNPVTLTIIDDEEPLVRVLAPNGGETIYTYGRYDITWSTSLGGDVSIDLLKAGSFHSSITSSTANDGFFAWEVPGSIADGADYRIRITQIGGNSETDASDGDFTIFTEPLALALDAPYLIWTTSGNGDWFMQSTTTQDGVDAAQSGDISHNQASSLETTLTGPGTLTFYWKVSSESGYDFLRFDINGIEQTGSLQKISGNVNWVQKTVDIPAGETTVKWAYTKDINTSSGSDAGWVDQVVFTPISGELSFSTASYNVNEADGSATITVERNNGSIGSVSVDYATSNGTAIAGSDYTATSGTLSWNDGDSAPKTFNVPIINDSIHGPPQVSLNLSLSNPIGGVLSDTNITATLNISEDDNQVTGVDAGTGETVYLTAVSAWTPTDISTAVWYDAAASTTITESGGAVSQWNDRSGNANHLVQATSAKQPTTGLQTIGGVNAMNFADDFMQTTSTNTNIRAVFFISDNLNGSSVNASVTPIFGETTGNASYTFVRTNATDYSISIDGNNSTNGAASVFGNTPTTGKNINLGLSTAEKGSPLNWYVQYDENVTIDYLGLVTSNETFHLIGSIGEFVALEAVPSLEDRQKMEGYLAHKWGFEANLPLSHPYKSDAPGGSSAEATLNASVTNPDNDVLSLLWTQVGGPAAVVFDDNTALNTNVTFTEVGIYTLRLTADDGYEESFDEVVITVELPPLSVSIADATISENAGTTTATISRIGTTGDLEVTLTSSDTGEATVPATATILDGNSSVDVTITGVTDGIVDGTQMVTITATAVGNADGADTVDVSDVDGVNDFAGWISNYSLGAENGFADDADHDGISNGIESYLGTHPGVFSVGLQPVSADRAAGTFTFSHPLSDNPASDITARYRWSKNLAGFHNHGETDSSGTTVSLEQGIPAGGMVNVTATVTGTTTEELFIIITVTQD